MKFDKPIVFFKTWMMVMMMIIIGYWSGETYDQRSSVIATETPSKWQKRHWNHAKMKGRRLTTESPRAECKYNSPCSAIGPGLSSSSKPKCWGLLCLRRDMPLLQSLVREWWNRSMARAYYKQRLRGSASLSVIQPPHTVCHINLWEDRIW